MPTRDRELVTALNLHGVWTAPLSTSDFAFGRELAAFLLTAPLYGSMPLPETAGASLLNWMSVLPLKIDCICPSCGKETTFTRHPPVRGTTKTWGGGIGNALTLSDLRSTLSLLEFDCARTPIHKAVFCLTFVPAEPLPSPTTLVTDLTIIKIGQYPALADIEAVKFAAYKKLVAEEDLAELKRASGLVSHGIGIGTFVYLRRIFERQIHHAHKRALSRAGWDDAAYIQGRMSERIKLLAHELPHFIVENVAMYGILSKGIQSLPRQIAFRRIQSSKAPFFSCLTRFERGKSGSNECKLPRRRSSISIRRLRSRRQEADRDYCTP